MYCPKCGQSVSDSTRFCSRCGLPLSGLAEWVAGNAGFAAPAEAAAAPPPLTPRRKGMRRGGKLMFIGGVLFPIFFIFALAADEPGPIAVPFLIFFVGLAVFLYARIFGDNAPPARSQPYVPPAFPPTHAGASLPPAHDAGFAGFADRTARTAELARPPSVTENTTRLLDKE
jgi:zinc-ribbon domain